LPSETATLTPSHFTNNPHNHNAFLRYSKGPAPVRPREQGHSLPRQDRRRQVRVPPPGPILLRARQGHQDQLVRLPDQLLVRFHRQQHPLNGFNGEVGWLVW
ncbi:hypothetical protein CT0861_07711, partial [Colletotrichum tofieldiae]